MIRRVFCFRTLILLGLFCMAGIVPAIAEAGSEKVAIPGFWDPKRRIERPPAVSGTVRFLTAPDFPPFNYLDASGELVGFNVDLARALCSELALNCTIQARTWETLLFSLKENRGDAIIAGLAANPMLRREAGLSDIYFKTPARFAVRNADGPAFVTPQALRGKTIGVLTGSAHAAFLDLYYDGAKIRRFEQATALHNALKNREVDAIFGDGIQIATWLNAPASEECCAFRGGPYLESRFFGEGQAIAVRKEQNQLRRLLNFGLQRLYENGTYAEIYLKWFPISVF